MVSGSEANDQGSAVRAFNREIDTDLADSSESYRMFMQAEETRKRTIRKVFAIILIVISGIIMVSGIKITGQSEHIEGYGDTSITYWHTAQLEYGIFFTIVGTLAVAFSVKYLEAVWKREGV